MPRPSIFAAGLAAAMALSGCMSEPGLEVSAAQYGDDWPFTVTDGRIDCRPSGAAVFVSAGKTYGLTGRARSRGYAAVDPIWLDNPKIPGTKLSLGVITKDALDLCR